MQFIDRYLPKLLTMCCLYLQVLFCTEDGDSTLINPTHVMQGMENVNCPQGNQLSGPNLDPGNSEDADEMLLVRLLRLVKFQLQQVELTITRRLQQVPGPFPGIKPPGCGVDNLAPSGTECRATFYPPLSAFFFMGPHWTTRFGFAARIFLLSDEFRLVWEPFSLLCPPLFLWESGRRVKLPTQLWLVF